MRTRWAWAALAQLARMVLEACGRAADDGCRHIVDDVRDAWQPSKSGEPDARRLEFARALAQAAKVTIGSDANWRARHDAD